MANRSVTGFMWGITALRFAFQGIFDSARGLLREPLHQDRPDHARHRQDRPGHDRRYAIDASKVERDLGWRPAETFDTGIRKTVQWYLDNPAWIEGVVSGSYRDWLQKQYN